MGQCSHAQQEPLGREGDQRIFWHPRHRAGLKCRKRGKSASVDGPCDPTPCQRPAATTRSQETPSQARQRRLTNEPRRCAGAPGSSLRAPERTRPEDQLRQPRRRAGPPSRPAATTRSQQTPSQALQRRLTNEPHDAQARRDLRSEHTKGREHRPTATTTTPSRAAQSAARRLCGNGQPLVSCRCPHVVPVALKAAAVNEKESRLPVGETVRG